MSYISSVLELCVVCTYIKYTHSIHIWENKIIDWLVFKDVMLTTFFLLIFISICCFKKIILAVIYKLKCI